MFITIFPFETCVWCLTDLCIYRFLVSSALVWNCAQFHEQKIKNPVDSGWRKKKYAENKHSNLCEGIEGNTKCCCRNIAKGAFYFIFIFFCSFFLSFPHSCTICLIGEWNSFVFFGLITWIISCVNVNDCVANNFDINSAVQRIFFLFFSLMPTRNPIEEWKWENFQWAPRFKMGRKNEGE